MITLAQALREYREYVGISLTDAAHDLGITKSYLSKLEAGVKKNPSFSLVHALVNYYSIPFEDLKAPFDE